MKMNILNLVSSIGTISTTVTPNNVVVAEQPTTDIYKDVFKKENLELIDERTKLIYLDAVDKIQILSNDQIYKIFNIKIENKKQRSNFINKYKLDNHYYDVLNSINSFYSPKSERFLPVDSIEFAQKYLEHLTSIAKVKNEELEVFEKQMTKKIDALSAQYEKLKLASILTSTALGLTIPITFGISAPAAIANATVTGLDADWKKQERDEAIILKENTSKKYKDSIIFLNNYQIKLSSYFTQIIAYNEKSKEDPDAQFKLQTILNNLKSDAIKFKKELSNHTSILNNGAYKTLSLYADLLQKLVGQNEVIDFYDTRY
ncbi:hypothetical protein H9M94_02900 [Mycoplasma sp. Pen4]|uniref:hypothetical protein n=1 Tax=Mycoplasma sp. Pen4 TaxID=640330 RepID=UPI00165463A7|nr:hypothetical protein [Mycoplasma sp. Pen4]QNM93535.1 hypothetical protein H9M94_02900 [Mycoplasma sp. Pen4]